MATSGPLLSACNFFHVIYTICLSMFYTKIVLLPLFLVVVFSSYVVHQLFDCHFEKSCFVCIAWHCFGIFFGSPFFRQYILICCIVPLVCCFVLVFSSQHIFGYLSFFSAFTCCRNFFTCSFGLISHSGFAFLFGEHRFYHRLVSYQHKLVHLLQWCCQLGYLFIIYFTFRFLS